MILSIRAATRVLDKQSLVVGFTSASMAIQCDFFPKFQTAFKHPASDEVWVESSKPFLETV